MYKKTLLILAVWLLSLPVWASPISEHTARAIAAQHLRRLHHKDMPVRRIQPYGQPVTRAAETGSTHPAFYMFNAAETDRGFVIVSGESDLPQLVGYATEGSLPAHELLPDAMRRFLDSYTDYVEQVRTGVAEANAAIRLPSGIAQSVEPLVKAKWGQSGVYNLYCPDKCPAGCVAVAMAQIMYSYQWPESGEGIGFTTYNNTQLRVNFSESVYDWPLMRETTKDTEGADWAVSKLIYDCGIACKMEYATSGSGANIVGYMPAFMNHFKYKASTLRYSKADFYATQEEWANLVLTEIAAGRPVLYGALSSIGAGPDTGHAFVISGYDESARVHVNWGWDGSSDGYYDLFCLNPVNKGYSFTKDMDMVYGITPNKDGDAGTCPPSPCLDNVHTDATTLAYDVNGSEIFKVKCDGFYNFSPTAGKWSWGVGLYTHDGVFMQKIQTGNFTKSIPAFSGYFDNSFSCKLPAGLESGEYVIRVFLKSGKEMIDPLAFGGWKGNYIRAVVSDHLITLDTKEATGIRSPKAEHSATSPLIYTLDGSPAGHTLDDLKRGIYVVNGKKVMK